jgi:MraZ protein
LFEGVKWFIVELTIVRRWLILLMGVYQNSIDTKNRLVVPAKFREELGYKCVLTRGLDQCLVIYPMETWAEQQKALAALPRSDEKARAFLRYMYANAVECEIDKQGRITLPQYLREIAKIDKELVTIGMLDRAELWDRDVYDNSENGGKLSPEDFKELGDTYQV